MFGFGSEALQFLRGQHSFESVHQRREGDGQPDVVQQPAQVFQRVRDTLQEMSLALVKSAKAISPQRLQDADVDVCVVKLQKGSSLHGDEAGKLFDVEIQQLLAQLRRQVG